MRTRAKAIAKRQAKRWAYEEHEEAMSKLPPEVRESISWDKVARRIGITWEELDMPDFEAELQRVIDYLYEDEAIDYQDLPRSEQAGHIFESILAVQRWLCKHRGE
jgi:hypothetical protein